MVGLGVWTLLSVSTGTLCNVFNDPSPPPPNFSQRAEEVCGDVPITLVVTFVFIPPGLSFCLTKQSTTQVGRFNSNN